MSIQLDTRSNRTSLLDMDIDYSDEKVLINTIIKYLPGHLREKLKYSNINIELKTPYNLNKIFNKSL